MCGGVASVVQVSGLATELDDPAFSGTLLAPSDTAFQVGVGLDVGRPAEGIDVQVSTGPGEGRRGGALSV